MGAPKKAPARAVSDDPEDLARVPLQAVLLADSFATRFRPITLERPKVLLPLVNIPMIEYTLAWLESAGVEEVFVFCCAHAKQVTSYLENSQWFSQPKFSVTTIESHNSVSAGDALRVIYERNVIHGEFVLISGDTLSNMSLTRALQEHKERKKKDSNAVMTMVIQRSKPSPITQQSRLGTDGLFMGIDPATKQLLYYQENTNHLKGTLSIDKMLLVDNASITLHNDIQDCYIDICSPEVLSLFTDNFDYQHLRRHFVKGLLVDDIMGYKIFTHEIHSSYAARVDNYRGYDTISKDIIQRWTYPLVPDVLSLGNSATKLERQGMYRASEIGQSRSAQIGPLTVIGTGTTIGSSTKITNSVVGKGCVIGSNVLMEGSYVWDNVIIEDGCELRHAIVCDGVVMKSGSVLKPGAVLSFKVVIGQNFVVPPYSKVSLLKQPTKQDSDEELEYADNNSDTLDSAATDMMDKLNGDSSLEFSEMQHHVLSELGYGGVGYIWSICEGSHEEEWRHSVAPIPAEKLAEITQVVEDDLELVSQDSNAPASSGELKPDTQTNAEDDAAYFEKEVEATFLRAVNENVEVEHVILEVNSLRLSYNMQSADCAGAIFHSMMKLALDTTHSSRNELLHNVHNMVNTWQKLLKSYLAGKDEEIEVILKFEEICLESASELSPLFTQILHLLYDKDIITEEAIEDWESEKKDADEADRVFVKQAEIFLQWLREASEEDDEEDDE
ncbi:uncharacterized protein LOC115685973 isoform X1 [Syzygium oleosum]|uniref:uncharacterized protein LOC115685973 isoform X1 n=1 Tax=Syzygium oleosum TaxID=219896 RepID=UPI0011D2B188|nr:uncharacterized protein LOC115685973 isoform X1 [Syzygium oleosum]